MIKINWWKFRSDHVWFGWRKLYIPNVRNPTPDSLGYRWCYSKLWEDRMFPVYNRHVGLPDWWLNFTSKFYND